MTAASDIATIHARLQVAYRTERQILCQTTNPLGERRVFATARCSFSPTRLESAPEMAERAGRFARRSTTMLMDDLVKARQADRMREAKKEQIVEALSPRRKLLSTLAQAMLAHWRATLVILEQTRPIRRRASAWLGQR